MVRIFGVDINLGKQRSVVTEKDVEARVLGWKKQDADSAEEQKAKDEAAQREIKEKRAADKLAEKERRDKDERELAEAQKREAAEQAEQAARNREHSRDTLRAYFLLLAKAVAERSRAAGTGEANTKTKIEYDVDAVVTDITDDPIPPQLPAPSASEETKKPRSVLDRLPRKKD